MHRLGLEVETRSEAPFLRMGKHKWGKREDFVETESYALQFKFKNLGLTAFPSGRAFMDVEWTSQQKVSWDVDIPQLNPGQEDYARFNTGSTECQSQALSSGFGLFFCRKIDPWGTSLTSIDGATQYVTGRVGNAVRSVKVTTWDTIYARYSMYISAAGLMIIALEKIVSFLFWASQFLATRTP
jgi:hypothetical protein